MKEASSRLFKYLIKMLPGWLLVEYVIVYSSHVQLGIDPSQTHNTPEGYYIPSGLGMHWDFHGWGKKDVWTTLLNLLTKKYIPKPLIIINFLY